MVRFSLFGIPVEIQPWFWVTGALLGGATHATTREGLLYTLVFMIVVTVSILVHEFGHALTGRRLGGGAAHIVLWAFGGLAYNRGARFTRWQNFWMTFMGPGAGFLLLLAVIATLCLVFGSSSGLGLSLFAATGMGTPSLPVSEAAADFVNSASPRWWIIKHLVWINFWWGLINLLPVLPLDGGRIADLWIRPQPRMFLVSAMTGTAMAAFGLLVMQSLYVALLFGFLAYRSFRDYQASGWR